MSMNRSIEHYWRTEGQALPLATRQNEERLVQPKRKPGMQWAYAAVLLFVIIYFFRPEDWIHGASAVPFEKISGGVAILAFGLGLLARGLPTFPREIKLLFLLFLQMCLSVPFAIWRGGSFDLVFTEISKILLITVVIAICINRLERLRMLFYVQALAALFITIFSIYRQTFDQYGRLTGAIGGVFGNPNDLALSLAIAVPLCFILMLESRSLLGRTFWVAVTVILSYGVMQTFSRSGFLALVTAVVACLALFGKVLRVRGAAILVSIAILVTFAVALTPRYQKRIASIVFQEQLDETGSAFARRELALKSVEVALEHPLFGIGPGNFSIVSGNWHVSHNTFLQLAADAGIPALLLFVVLLRSLYRKLRDISRKDTAGRRVQIYANGLRAALLCYVVAAFFADTAYQFFPYFLVAYGSLVCEIARRSSFEAQKRMAFPKTAATPVTTAFHQLVTI